MKKIRAAVVGYGNIGHYALQALEAAPDFEVAGIVRRNGAENKPEELARYDVVKDIRELQDVDVAILATPTRSVEKYAKEILALGINTVDSFDIHPQITSLRRSLDESAKAGKAVSVISAGWDPGSDSVVRAMLQAIAPKGITYTNFGPGMSMGHTVAVKAVEGVQAALSMTIPTGTGIHRRMVYIEVKEGYEFSKVAAAIKADPYFVNDETHVIEVPCVDELLDMGRQPDTQRRIRKNPEPVVRVQHAYQQSGADGTSIGLRGPCLDETTTRLLHDDRNTCHRPASGRARRTDCPFSISLFLAKILVFLGNRIKRGRKSLFFNFNNIKTQTRLPNMRIFVIVCMNIFINFN